MTAPDSPGGVELRPMRWWDIEPVLALEAELFAQDAWSAGMLWAELAGATGPAPTREYVVAEAPGEVGLAGYAGLGVAGDTGEVMTIGVAGAHQGTGLGGRLLARMLGAAGAFGCAAVMLEVRVDNEPAKRLYRRFGFRQVGVRRGYYQPGNRDALVMRRELATEAASGPEPTRENVSVRAVKGEAVNGGGREDG
ncbi:ribosomal-protein-alanine N-acetyltransferase [Streptomyces zhaozhouensis]|uniref:Ribosomal-protein-alanine N-acetyltransferase n=1 Tax=Streptomyces zhaozhouensis TaxID=1300267 RepID=A0A286DTQ4_9ACTN|nr:ribosomal protein S18-alanine N-acetyltransferase [Streptomyces zhaozhouensis]SOD61934.1 ribosomal-protein-alanine N-acetyltransferase [Streptomyces zhaozhouensis]